MKDTYLLLLLSLLFFLHPAPGVLADSGEAEKDSKKIVVLTSDEIVVSDYFAAGESVTVSGTVKGDAYVAGGSVDFEGTVEGDLIAAGGVVNIRGEVMDDVRLSGGEIVISGDIKGNVTVAGGSITITDSANIGGSLVSAGGNINVFAPVGSDITAGAGSLTLANNVGGRVKAGAGEIILTSKAVIEGDFKYYSRSKASIQKGAVVKGEILHTIPSKAPVSLLTPAMLLGFGFLFYLIFELVSTFIVGLLVIKFYPNFVNKIVETIETESLRCLGVGLLGIILTPVIFTILLITLIGIPLGIILILAFIIYLYLSKVFVSVFLGHYILKLFKTTLNKVWTLLTGIIIFMILTLIPFLGGALYLLSLILGLGSLLIIKKEVYKQLRNQGVA